MKIKNLMAGIFLLGSVGFFQACNEDQILPETTGGPSVKSSSLNFLDSCTFSGVLTDAEIEGLMEMREEEKLAHDVYLYLYDLFGQPVFANIANSEAVHTNAVLQLIKGYGLEDPASGIQGEFSNPAFAELYAELTEKGSVSLVEALKVGAFIEEYDINDLMLLLENTQNADVARVYGNLLRGSESHLRAFTNSLIQNGESYNPSVISETLYQEILAAANQGKGNSNQYGNGKGSGNKNDAGTGQGNQGSGNKKKGKN